MSSSKLDHLVVVHTNMLDLKSEKNRILIQNIRHRAGVVMEAGYEVFLLPIRGFPDLETNGFFPELPKPTHVIPQHPLENLPEGILLKHFQFIRLKLALVAHSIFSVDLTGVARSNCVQQLDDLLKGVKPSQELLKWADESGLAARTLDEVLRTKMDSKIIEELRLD